MHSPSFLRRTGAFRAALVLGTGLLAFAPARIAAAAQAGATVAPAEARGAIEGRVFHTERGEYLNNARVTVKGTELEAFTDASGFYRLTNVPAGPVTVNVFYTGVRPDEQRVTVPAGGVAVQDFKLAIGAPKAADEPIKLEEVTVSASKEMDSAAIAINEQRFASNIVNVVATDEFGTIAEGNIGEFLKFMPGITIDYNGGDARQVQLNGVPSDYTPITVGGFDLASASSSSTARTIELEQVSINNMSRIEVHQSPTPDQPGNSLAGSVNLVPRNAFERAKPVFNYSVFMTMRDSDRDFHRTPGPMKNPERKVHPGVDFNYVVPVNKRFGFTLSGANSKQYVAQDYMVMGWAGVYVATNGTTLPITTPDKPYLTEYQNRVTTKVTGRSSLGATLDFRLARSDTLSVGFQWSYFDADFGQRDLIFNVGSVAAGNFDLRYTHGNAGAGYVNNVTSTRRKSGTTWMPTATYRHNGPIWRFESGVGYSHASNHYRDIDGGKFNGVTTRRTGVTVNFDDNFYLRPGSVTVTTAAGAPVDPYTLGNFALVSTSTNQPDSSDVKTRLYADIGRELDLRIPVALKTGVDLRRTVRDIEGGSVTYNFVGADGKGSTTPVGSDDNAGIILDPVNSLRPAPYGFPAVQRPSGWLAWDLFNSNPGYFTATDVSRYTAPVNASKHIDELISAAYLRGDVQLLKRRLKVTTGIRAEQTNVKAEGPLNDPTRNFQRDASGAFIVDAKGNPLLIQPSGSLAATQLTRIRRGSLVEKEYLRWFPSINTTYVIRENLLARASYSWGIGRPNLNQYAGGITLPDLELGPTSSNRITVNNPAIKPWTSKSLKASLEYYFARVGLLSVGVFQRDFKNFFVDDTNMPSTPEILAAYNLDPSLYGAYQIDSQRNSPDNTRLSGVEFNYKQALTFLPHWARGVQVFANGTQQRVEGAEADNFQGYIPRTVNWGVSLSRPKYNVKVNWNYRFPARRLAVASTAKNSIEPGTYTWSQRWLFVDVNAEYYLRKRLAVFANLRNIRDQAEDYEVYGPNTPAEAQFRQSQKYGALWTFGIKGSF